MIQPPSGPPTLRPANRNLTATVWALLVLGIVVVLAAGVREIWLSSERRDFRVLPTLAQVPSFQLMERDGQPRSLADLHGQIWLADFFFTSCPGPCPALTAKMAELSQALRRTKGKVRLVSITVDPEVDTPERLQSYAKKFQASPDWWFLTGSMTDLFRLARDGFKLAVAENPPEAIPSAGKMLHSTKIALVDGQGRVRAYYNGTDADLMAKVLPDVGDLLHEAGEGQKP